MRKVSSPGIVLTSDSPCDSQCEDSFTQNHAERERKRERERGGGEREREKRECVRKW